MVVTFGLPWALLALFLSLWLSCGTLAAWLLLVLVTGLRLAVTLLVGWSVLRDRQVLPLLPLLPLRDLVAPLVWIASLTGHTVMWRGESFRLKNGKLVRIGP
jgi:ceramide glucosyltransferase